MHDDDAVGAGDFLAVAGNDRIELRVLPEFRRGEQRWELFLTKVVKNDLVTVSAKRVCRRAGDGVVETPGIRMGEDDGNVHQFTAFDHPPALPRFFSMATQ